MPKKHGTSSPRGGSSLFSRWGGPNLSWEFAAEDSYKGNPLGVLTIAHVFLRIAMTECDLVQPHSKYLCPPQIAFLKGLPILEVLYLEKFEQREPSTRVSVFNSGLSFSHGTTVFPRGFPAKPISHVQKVSNKKAEWLPFMWSFQKTQNGALSPKSGLSSQESCWTTSTPDGDGAAEAPEPSISAAPEPSVSATPEMSPSGRKIEKPAGREIRGKSRAVREIRGRTGLLLGWFFRL